MTLLPFFVAGKASRSFFHTSGVCKSSNTTKYYFSFKIIWIFCVNSSFVDFLSTIELTFCSNVLSSTSVRFPKARTHLGLRLDLGLRLGQNGARSRIDHYLCFMGFLFFFSFFAFGFDNDLIMVGLCVVACGGCGLWVRWWWCWVVGFDSGGGRVGGNASWVSIFFFFFCFLIVGFMWFWLASGLKNERDFWSGFKGFNWFWMCNWKFWNIFTNVMFLCSWGKDSMVRVFDLCYV